MSNLVSKDQGIFSRLSEVTSISRADESRLRVTLEGLLLGQGWSDIVSNGGLTLSEYVYLRRVDKVFKELSDEVMSMREEVRKYEREEAAHRRAIEGEEVPVYNVKGEYCGSYKKASDSLLQLLLKGDNPKKYGNTASGSGVQVLLNFDLRKILEE